MRRERGDHRVAMEERSAGLVGHLGHQGVDPGKGASFGATRRRAQLDDGLAGRVREGVDLDQVGIEALERSGRVEVAVVVPWGGLFDTLDTG
jgi:hypothetical protein